MDLRAPVVGILVGGTPAPGINAVISAVSLEGINSNCDILGFYEGFKYIKTGNSKTINLEAKDVTRIPNLSGSILRTSLDQLTTDQEVDNCLRVFQYHRIRFLVTIGGTKTAYSASLVAKAAREQKIPFSLVHIPKTIFNDLPLPTDSLAFGFSTARQVGLQLVENFKSDARTMLKWYIVVVSGQRSGQLPLAIGKAAAATLTIIPEEYDHLQQPLEFDALIARLEACIYKRRAQQKDYGVIVLAEGLVDRFAKSFVECKFKTVKKGHRMLASSCAESLNTIFAEKKLKIEVEHTTIGNELRSAPPNSEDQILARDLGFGAMRFLFQGGSDCLCTMQGGQVLPIPLEDIVNVQSQGEKDDEKKKGLTTIRKIDLSQVQYQVAIAYMIQLNHSDLTNPVMLNKMAESAKMEPKEFVERFQPIARGQPGRGDRQVSTLQPMLRFLSGGGDATVKRLSPRKEERKLNNTSSK